MNKFGKVVIGFLLIMAVLSIVSFVFNVMIGLVAFAFKAFVFFSVVFFAYKWVQSVFNKKDERS